MKLTILLLIFASFALANGTEDNQTITTASPTENITTTLIPETQYIPTDAEQQMVLNCFHRRVWDRLDEDELSQGQLFCKRLAANLSDSNTFPSDVLNRFASYRNVWDKLVDEKFELVSLNLAMSYWKWNLDANLKLILLKSISKEEKNEIEECYFYRSWQSIPEAQHTSHESFCSRVSTFKPNDIELRDVLYFLGQNKVWELMPDAAMNDLADIAICFPMEGKVIPERSVEMCNVYLKRVESPSSWRDIRLKEVHECIQDNVANPNGPHKNRCHEVIRDFQRIYLQSS